jgi:hypothetical protein
LLHWQDAQAAVDPLDRPVVVVVVAVEEEVEVEATTVRPALSAC